MHQQLFPIYTMVYILFIAIFLFLATITFTKLLKNNSRHRNLDLPPVVKAWPLVGVIFMLAKDPLNLIKKNYEKYGSVFTMKVLGQSVTILIGPEVSSHFYMAPESDLSREELFKFTVPMFGQNVVYGVSREIRRQQFQFLKKGLRPEMLRHYFSQTFEEVQDYFSKWQDCGTIDLMHELQHLVILATTRCLLGNDVRVNLSEEVSSLIRDLAGGLRPFSFLFPYLPTPAHYRRDRARGKLHHIFSNIINTRKSSLGSEQDLLQTLMKSTYINGESTTNEQLVGLSIAILFVGGHTAGLVAVSTGAYLLQNKAYFSKAKEEQKELLHRHGSKIDFDILGEMDVLYRCIKECIRLGSISPVIIPRYCHKTFTVTTKEGKEYMIPKGHIVATSIAMANRLDYIYKDPDSYDPDRYLSIEEEMASRPFSDVSFGGGRHPCTGEVFAYIIIKTIWSYLIRNFELDLASTFPEDNGKEKVLVHYKRRQLSI